MAFFRGDFFIHVLAILVAEAIIGIAFWFWKSQLYSAFSSLFGGDVVLTGEWQVFLTRAGQAEALHEQAQLSQFGRRVWGKTKTVQGRRYGVEGKIYASTLVMTYHEIGSHAFESGASVLKILPGDKEMKGCEIEQDPQGTPQ